MDDNTLFDVTGYLRDAALNDDYSLFDDMNGGLFAKTPVETTPRDVKKFSNEKSSFEYGDIPEYPYANDLDEGLDGLELLDQGLTATELEWLNKSEDEIRNKIFELAEEIQLESKKMYQPSHRGLTMSRASVSVTENSSPSRNSFSSGATAALSDHNLDDPSLLDLKWCSTPINGPIPNGSSSRVAGSSSEQSSSPALSSYVGASSSRDGGSSKSSAASMTQRMPFLSLDSKPKRSDRFPQPRVCQPISRDVGLVDWRVAARTAEQNAQRNENALGYDDIDDRRTTNSTAIGAKRRLCRHFLKGFCNRGDTCDFLHDNSIFCPDEQKVFLGGLPTHITAESLCTLLKEMNYTVINKPKILRGFTPQVCLSSVTEAQELIRKRKIYLDNTPVDVRPYEDRKPPDDLKRSVFLGGLAADTTVEHIQEDLARAGFPVENNPILKAGFVPQVVLESVEKAQELIKMAKIRINGKSADVRPYVNFRKRY